MKASLKEILLPVDHLVLTAMVAGVPVQEINAACPGTRNVRLIATGEVRVTDE